MKNDAENLVEARRILTHARKICEYYIRRYDACLKPPDEWIPHPRYFPVSASVETRDVLSLHAECVAFLDESSLVEDAPDVAPSEDGRQDQD